MTTVITSVILIDKRIEDYNVIVESVKSDVRCIVYDVVEVSAVCEQQSITQFEYIVNKINELGLLQFANIGIIQHNLNVPTHQFFGADLTKFSIVESVEQDDPSLQTWSGFSKFITTLKNKYSIQNVDLMACALYSNQNWKYIIDNLSFQTGVNFRASTDDTGSSTLGGNWFLESHTGVNLKTVYFTDAIDSYTHLLTLATYSMGSSNGKSLEYITTPSTLAVWGNNVGSTSLDATLSAKLVNIKKVFSYSRNSNGYIFALDTNGVLYAFGNKAFGSISSNVLNNQTATGHYDYMSFNGMIGLIRSDGYVSLLTDDPGASNAFSFLSTFNFASNPIAVYNLALFNADPNRRFAVLDTSSQVKIFMGPRNSSSIYLGSGSPSETYTNVARLFYGRAGTACLLKRDRTVATNDNGVNWTNVANIITIPIAYGSYTIFGIDVSQNLLYTANYNNYNYDGLGMVNFTSSVTTNVVTVKTSGLNTYGVAILLQTNGNVSCTSMVNLGSSHRYTSQGDQAVNVYISIGSYTVSNIVEASMKYDGTVYIRGSYGTNSLSNVHDVIVGEEFIAFLLTNGNVVLHTSANTLVNVVTTNNAVGLFLYKQNEVNVVLNDGSLVRYYNGSITYDTTVVRYNGNLNQSSTILNSNVSGAIAAVGIQAASIGLSVGSSVSTSSLTSFNNMELYDYFMSRNNRRMYNFNSLNGNYSISDYRTLTLINPFLPTNKSYKLIIPDYQSAANLSSSPYSTTNVTLGPSVENFIVAIEDGEMFTINGNTSTTYVLHNPYLYTVTTSPSFALTKVTTLTTDYNTFTLYGDGGFSGTGNPVSPSATLSNFSIATKTFGDASFNLTAPTSNNNPATFTYSVPAGNGVATISGSTVTITGAGSVVVTATQSASNGYLSASITATLTVNAASPTYQSVAQITKTYGTDVSFSLTSLVSGISNSNGAYTFTSASGAISISGAVVTILAYTPTAISITASQAASGNYAASSTTLSLLVNRGPPTYQSVAQITKTYGTDVSFSLTSAVAGISNSSGAYTFSSGSSAISISGSVVTILAYTPSAVSITASQDASGNYAASSTTLSLLVNRGPATYQSVSQITKTYGTDVSFSLTSLVAGISSSSGAYTFSSSNGEISISGDVVTILAYTPTAASITASQDASGNYAASSTTLSLLVNRGPATYQSVAQITKTYGTDVSFSLTSLVAGISNSSGAYTFSSGSSAVDICGDVVTILAYTPTAVSITASQDAAGNYAASSTTLSLLVNRGPPTYQSVAQITKTYGTDVSFSLTSAMEGISNSSGAYTFSSGSSAISISGSVVTILAYTPSAVSITASQDASGNYAASSTTLSLLVNRKVPSYGAFSVPAKTYGDASFSIAPYAPTSENTSTPYTYTSSTPSVATISSDGTIVTVIGQGYTTITASQDASGNYSAGSTTTSFLVNRAAPTFLKAFTIPDKTFGDASFSLLPFTEGLDNTDGTYHFSSSNSQIVSISETDGVTATILGYTPTPVTIYVAIDACGNYAASSTSGTLTVARAAPTYQAVSSVTKTYGNAAFSLVPYMSGISNSNASYSFTSSDPSAVSIDVDGYTATILNYTPSPITITASQDASGNYSAGSTTFSLSVSRATPTIGAIDLGPYNGYYDISGYITLTPPASNSSGAFTYAVDNSAVAVITTDISFTTPNLIARYDPSVSSNYTMYSGRVSRLSDLTGNGRHLDQYAMSVLPATVGTKTMLDFTQNDGAGLYGYLPMTTNLTFYMVMRYTSNIPTNGVFAQHGNVDTDWSIIKKPTGSNYLLFKSNNDTTNAGLQFTTNTSYILVCRVNGNTREFWAYSESGSSQYTSTTGVSIAASHAKYLYIGKSQANILCSGYVGEILYYNTNLSAMDFSNNLTYLQKKWFNASNSTQIVRFIGNGNVNITATQDICGNYTSGSVSALARVGATVPYIPSFSVSASTKKYGDAPFTIVPPVSNSDGSFTYTSSDTNVISISGNTATIVGAGYSTITAYQDPSGSYTRGSISTWFTVQKASPNLRNFGAIVKSLADGSFIVTPPDTDNPGSSFQYSRASGSAVTNTSYSANFTIVSGGNATITATQLESVNFTSESITTTVTITPIVPTSSYSDFTRPFSIGGFAIPPPTTNSDGTFTYTSSDTSVVTISGASATILKTGTSIITARIAATASYNTQDISAVLTVERGTPTINGLSNINKTILETPYVPSPTSNSNGTFTYVSDNSGVVLVSNGGTTLNMVSVGSANITATITQDTSGNYNSHTANFVLTVIRATSSFSTSTFSVPNSMTYGDSPVNITTVPTSDSSGAITYASSNTNIATIHPTTGLITAVGAGAVYFIATQAQTGVYNSNTRNSNNMSVNRMTITQSKNSPYTADTITKYYGDAAFQLSTTSISTASKTYSLSTPSVVSISNVSNVANVTINNVGTVTITGSQLANSQYTTSNNAVWVLTVEKGTTALTGLSPTISKNVTDAAFYVSATSSSMGTKSYALSDPSNAAVLTVNSSSGLVTLKGPGSARVIISQAASSLYNAPVDVSCVITVTEAGSALQGATISSDRVFTNVDMSGASLANTTISGVSFSGATLANAVLSSATVVNATMSNATLSNATFSNSDISGTTFSSATMTSANLSNTTLTNTTMTSAVLTGATMTSANISGTTFTGATMSNVNMTSAILTNTTMTNAVLSDATMSNANISGTTFTGATMSNVNMTSAILTNTTMTNAVLSGATMTSADISGTTFTSATLTNVNMANSKLTNSTMSNAVLTGATMTNATITGTTFANATIRSANFTGATMTNSTLTSTDLSGSILRLANVSGSNFVGAVLANADLSGAVVTNANFTNANIKGANIDNVAFSPLQKLQLLKNTNNRTINKIQVSDVSGSTILSAISPTSPALTIPNIETSVVKVIIPQTTTVAADPIPNVTLDTTTSDKFYFPINTDEYFQLNGVKYYVSDGAIKDASTNETVTVITYGDKRIWLIAGSVIASVLQPNPISTSTFTVRSSKLDTETTPFPITVKPTSASTAPIVYSSNNPSVATIDPSSGMITVVSMGYVSFIASQVETELYEAGSKTSNEMFVNRLINFSLPVLNQTIVMNTAGTLDASAGQTEATDAGAVFYVKQSDMMNVFKFLSDSADMNEDPATDVKYYVFYRNWPTELHINPIHAMMNKPESENMLGNVNMFDAEKMLVKHDFIRYLSLRLFNTIHGVDLFNNEMDLLENATYNGEYIRNNINNIMMSVSTTSDDESMAYDASGNKYLTNDVSGNTNLCREILRQMSASAPGRFSSITSTTVPQSIPFLPDDSITFKLTIQAAPSQNLLTGVVEIPSRSYLIKLIIKETLSGESTNTAVLDSEMYPNSYPYSSSIVTYAPTADSSGVYNVYSPPATIPFSRFGYNGWYYTNSNAWVNVASSVRNHVKWIVPANRVGVSTVGELQYIRMNLKVWNKTSIPYLMVYTQSGGYRKYSFATPSFLVNGTLYTFYMNFNSYAREPAAIGYTNEEFSYSGVSSGSFSNSDIISGIAVETDSNASRGSVEFTLSSVTVGELETSSGLTGEKEYGFSADVPTVYP